MSSNLDHSLDEIIAARPRPNRRGGKGTASAVSGGIRKRSQRAAAQKANASVTPNAVKAATRAPPTGPSGKATKIIVSNLPFDVNEQMIKLFCFSKEYFQSVVGPIRRAILTYGPDGRSRGVATVEFAKSEHAETAAQKYNGVEVDKRPMKVELVVDPSAPASFADRVGAPNKIINKQPKGDKPKPVVKPTAARGGARGGARGNKRGGRSGSGSGRGKPKTAEQLDQDMSDYFGGDSTNASGAAPAAATATNGGDVGMDDTVLVGTP
ncbi:hypothetical protein BDD12DRAFT_150311 [Trichophaea hybrida]|nr:hypothetical protein BDD12DRAFT_150311 [Trichophaea hybrida]